MQLTATQIKYVLAMRELQESGPMRLTQIANHMGVTKPTVHSMLGQLKKFAVVCQTPNGRLELTEMGARLAQEYEQDYQRVRMFLQTHLPMKEAAVHESAMILLGSENKAANDWRQCMENLEEARG